jgi:hypothetical protein
MAYSKSFPIPDNMLNTITACTAGLGGVGLVGGAIGPGADIFFIVPTWVGMVIALANQAGVSLDDQTAKKLCMTVLTGSAFFIGGTKAASTAFAWLLALPTLGASLAANAVVNAGLNATFTRAFGRATALYFLQTSKIENVDVAARVLLALIGLEFNIPTSNPEIVA